MITADQFRCSTHDHARKVAAQLERDGWIDVTPRGSFVYFPTTSNHAGARDYVSVVAAVIGGGK